MINKSEYETWDRKCTEVKLIKFLRAVISNRVKLQQIPIDKWRPHYPEQLKEDRQEYLTSNPRRYSV